MIHDFLDKLRAPLADETRQGYLNTAVEGDHYTSLDRLMLALCREALDAVERGEWAATAEFRVQRLHDIWARYGEAEEVERERLVAESLRLLDGIAQTERMQSAGAPQSDGEVPMRWHQAGEGWDGTGENGTSTGSVPQSVATITERIAAAPIQNARAKITNRKGPALDTELTYLKGIGPKRAEALGKLGLHTVYDLLYYFPDRYEDRRLVKTIEELQVGAKESFCATVLYAPQTRAVGGRGGGRNLTRVRVGDATGHLDLQWWNQTYREKQFEIGMQLFIYGKVAEFNGFLQVDSPDFEVMSSAPTANGDGAGAVESGDPLQVGRIVPVYRMTEGLFQIAIRRAISKALESCVDDLEEVLPQGVREQFGLQGLAWSLRQIHFPDDLKQQEAARRRLVFEELFLLQVALAQKKFVAHSEVAGIRHLVEDADIKKFVAALPFKLTGAQKRVMNEVRRDLKSPRPMNRLLHGDVGSGKTIVAAFALWMAQQSGHQGALLAPTEILAEQHFSVLSRLFQPMGIEVALLEGSLKTAQKRRVQADINEGRVSIIVGTHALIQEGIEFNKLGVCVVDEQHRFGVMQRAALSRKGQEGAPPDVLVMTATPIPRTMALTIYGDLDVSVLDELPPGRQPIKTIAIKPPQRQRAYQYILDEVKKGRQAYVVCPLVEESEKLAHLKAATALADRLRAEELNLVRVGLVHGQMSVMERDEEMELFRAGMRDVLVSTTVIEVGVDVPNASIMLIEDAERFGLSQLHQLRGRVGRGEFKSMCVLMGDPRTDEGRQRIKVMTKTQNGFEIAEDDLRLRGPGEFYGTRQSGLPDFRLANIINDVDVIAQAREAATQLIHQDPNLEWDEHQPLLAGLKRFWGDKLSLVQVS